MPSGKGRPKAFQPQFGKFYYDNKSTPGCGARLEQRGNRHQLTATLWGAANSRKMFYVPAAAATTSHERQLKAKQCIARHLKCIQK